MVGEWRGTERQNGSKTGSSNSTSVLKVVWKIRDGDDHGARQARRVDADAVTSKPC